MASERRESMAIHNKTTWCRSHKAWMQALKLCRTNSIPCRWVVETYLIRKATCRAMGCWQTPASSLGRYRTQLPPVLTKPLIKTLVKWPMTPAIWLPGKLHSPTAWWASINNCLQETIKQLPRRWLLSKSNNKWTPTLSRTQFRIQKERPNWTTVKRYSNNSN